MKKIPLTSGQFAIVDDADYLFLATFNWHVAKHDCSFYAVRNVVMAGKRTLMQMHRLIMGFPKEEVDHRDGNGLNNCRANLRLASKNWNQWNRRKTALLKTSRFKGVSWGGSNWLACIRQDRIRVYLGSFPTEEAAAMAYNTEALKRFGEFARVNEV